MLPGSGSQTTPAKSQRSATVPPDRRISSSKRYSPRHATSSRTWWANCAKIRTLSSALLAGLPAGPLSLGRPRKCAPMEIIDELETRKSAASMAGGVGYFLCRWRYGHVHCPAHSRAERGKSCIFQGRWRRLSYDSGPRGGISGKPSTNPTPCAKQPRMRALFYAIGESLRLRQISSKELPCEACLSLFRPRLAHLPRGGDRNKIARWPLNPDLRRDESAPRGSAFGERKPPLRFKIGTMSRCANPPGCRPRLRPAPMAFGHLIEPTPDQFQPSSITKAGVPSQLRANIPADRFSGIDPSFAPSCDASASGPVSGHCAPAKEAGRTEQRYRRNLKVSAPRIALFSVT